uniref:Uncharacterized protein n=1 Tax=viral metagenome TaxID=1070528 RepID=A0A6C0BYT7_9ZZZZ
MQIVLIIDNLLVLYGLHIIPSPRRIIDGAVFIGCLGKDSPRQGRCSPESMTTALPCESRLLKKVYPRVCECRNTGSLDIPWPCSTMQTLRLSFALSSFLLLRNTDPRGEGSTGASGDALEPTKHDAVIAGVVAQQKNRVRSWTL